MGFRSKSGMSRARNCRSLPAGVGNMSTNAWRPCRLKRLQRSNLKSALPTGRWKAEVGPERPTCLSRLCRIHCATATTPRRSGNAPPVRAAVPSPRDNARLSSTCCRRSSRKSGRESPSQSLSPTRIRSSRSHRRRSGTPSRSSLRRRNRG